MPGKARSMTAGEIPPDLQFSRDNAMTTRRTRSRLRARLIAKLQTGRILQRRLVQTELPVARTAGRGSHFRAHGGG